MSYRFQKILLTIELIIVVAVTLYTGTYAAIKPEKVAAVESVAETKESETVKDSESKKVSETKKAEQTKETKAKDKKQETEPETKTQKAADNKVESENKNTVSSGKSGNTSTTTSKNNNPSTTSGGNNNSSSSGTNNNAPAPSTPSTSAPSTPQTEATEPARPQTPETTHTHNWVESTHEELREDGHWGEKVIEDAWDEPVYDMVEKSYCSTCNKDITKNPWGHVDEFMHAGFWSTWEPVEIDSVHHEAIKEPVWIVDRTWTETVGDGYYICSECGARK